eukprot:851127-Pleurochrysis_carterae.AAC.2
MSGTRLFFNTAHLFDRSADAIDGEMAEASVNKIFELPNLPLARSTVSLSLVNTHTRVSEARVTV